MKSNELLKNVVSQTLGSCKYGMARNRFPPKNTLEITPQDYKDRDNDERQDDK